MKSFIALLFAAMLATAIPNEAHALIGLSTRFVDVTLEYLEVGRAYNLRQLRNIPYTVRNRGDADVPVKVDVVIPKKDEVSDGYEAIPDPNWIQLLPNRFTILAGQTAYAEMIIQVPNKPEYIGKHYQAKIFAHSDNPGLFSVGTQSRLRFSTGPGPETLKGEAIAKEMTTMDFDVTPQEIYAEVEPGQTINLSQIIQRKLKVTNRGEKPFKMKFKSVAWVSTLSNPQDYVPAPEKSWLTFSPEEAVIKGDRVVSVDPIIKIPAGDENRGKKLMFLMKADIYLMKEKNWYPFDLEVYTKVFVTVKNK